MQEFALACWQPPMTTPLRCAKSWQLLGRFDQPVQHGVGVDLEDPRRGADTETFGQAREGPHDEFDGRLFAVENRPVGLQKIPLTRGTVERAPGAATGMTVGAEIPQPEPPPVITTGMRTKVPRGIDCTGTPVGRCHGIGRHRRRRFGRRGFLLTQGAMGLFGQTLERFGFVRAGAAGAVTPGLGQVRCTMMKSHTMAKRASW